jgi:hypothetical protein
MSMRCDSVDRVVVLFLLFAGTLGPVPALPSRTWPCDNSWLC